MGNKLFGTDGVRGVANVYPMTAEFALKLGMAAGQLICRKTRRAAVARDTRISGEMLEAALTAGFNAAGVTVLKLGVVPTPAATMLTPSLGVDMTVMITASHNPYQDNGIKLINADGDKFSDAETARIEAAIAADDFKLNPDEIGVSEAVPDAAGAAAPAAPAPVAAAPAAPAPAAAPAAAGQKTVIVVGGGPGGYVAAIRAAQLGAKVTLVEREHIGGTCLNIGCIPTKCLLHSAELVSEIKEQGADIGVKVSGVEVDFPQVIAHKNAISKQLTQGVAGLLKQNKVARVDGEASFTGPKTLSVKKSDGSVEEMTADAIIVATGSVNAQPPIPGLKENPNCIDSTGALSLEKLPKSMVVIGGGVIGLELACAYAAFGTKITVVEALDHMLPMLDGDLTAIGVKHMKKMGMEFNLECPVQAVEASPVGAKVVCKNKAGETVSFEAEKVLVAIGRKANTASLNLEAAGLANDRGRIIVNDKMETSVPGVYAIGDCVFGKAQLAHTASAMGEVAAENIMGIPAVYDEKTNPTCVYMEPEAASVGLTEEQCKAKGIDYKVGKFPLVANGKSLIINGGEGLVKIIADAKYEEVLGMHIIGPRATDLIAEGALALRLEATVDELISTIHSHPTVSESVRECALNVQKRAIHIKN